VGPTLSGFLAEGGRAAAMAAFLDGGRAPRGAPHPREVWEAVFPMVLPPAEPDGLGAVLLDSNALTQFSFTNALGILAAQELHAAERAMAQWPEARWLVCLHHHLVEYPRAGVKLADRIATALTNGHWVLARLRRQAARLVVLHGHRHTDWTGECGGVRILSAPSPVMGPADPATPRGFWIHGLAPGPAGALDLLAPERVVVPGQPGKASP
ncbi:metallophosphoesterase family protein, partial [Falsiroseomonas oryzae]|uniref:metallophosphoesterase family protein n=1 Tax=Falsiroseomonas oryzae TaxID=2766473 RepID=UPI0022EB89EF